MAVNIVFGTVLLPEESFMRHFNLSRAFSLPAWNYSRNRFDFQVIAVVKLLLVLAYTDYFSSSSSQKSIAFSDGLKQFQQVGRGEDTTLYNLNYWDTVTKIGVLHCSCLSHSTVTPSALEKRYCFCLHLVVPTSFVLFGCGSGRAHWIHTGTLLMTMWYLLQALPSL